MLFLIISNSGYLHNEIIIVIITDRISTMYLQDSILFLLGGVIIALAVEYSNLHTRIAVKVILLVGAKISR